LQQKLAGAKSACFNAAEQNEHDNVPSSTSNDLLSPSFFPSHNQTSQTDNERQRNKELQAMTKFADDRWNAQREKLVEFEQNEGHCMVPKCHKQDNPLGWWVSVQWTCHDNDKL
jgi:hypothetical protein